MNKFLNISDKMADRNKENENEVCEYFYEIKRQVNLRKDDLKKQIDICSTQIINKIEEIQEDYLGLAKNMNESVCLFEKFRRDLNDLNSKYETLSKRDPSLNYKIDMIKTFKLDYDDFLKDYKHFDKYKFQFDDVDVKKMFGSFVEDLKCSDDLAITYDSYASVHTYPCDNLLESRQVNS